MDDKILVAEDPNFSLLTPFLIIDVSLKLKNIEDVSAPLFIPRYASSFIK